MKIYCPHCGSPNSYASKKPNFCQNCGKPFGETKADTSMPTPQRSPGIVAQEDHEADEDYGIEEVPDINGLDVEIESGKIQGIEMGNVVGTVEPREQNTPKGKKPKKGRRQSKKKLQEDAAKFLKEFQREAGTRGRQNSE
jgi:hypothetical protein